MPCLAGWNDEHERGWHWYEKKSEETENEKDKQLPLKNDKASYAKQLTDYREQGEELRAKAILEPTAKSLADLMQWEKTMWEKAEYFGNMWQMVLRSKPDLDYSIQNPTSQYARHVYLDVQQKKLVATFKKFRNEYGLILFYKENCPYCHIMLPVVRTFSEKYGLNLNALSLDEKLPSNKQSTIPNIRLGEQFNVTAVPALFAVSPHSGDYFPISNGAVSEQELEERIIQIIEFRIAEEEK